MVAQLGKACYFSEQYHDALKKLKARYAEHLGDAVYVNLRSRRMLSCAFATVEFLAHHQPAAMLVEGDKGKVMALVPRPTLCALVGAFISDGLLSGMFFCTRSIFLIFDPDILVFFVSGTYVEMMCDSEAEIIIV